MEFRTHTRLAGLAAVLLLTAMLAEPAAGADELPTTLEECEERTLELSAAQAKQPVGALVPCPGIRPGATIVMESGGSCTLNFVFHGTSRDQDGNAVDEGLFIGTAGHCPLDEDAEIAWSPGTGPVAEDASGRRIGEFAYAVDEGNWDFALIRIDPDRYEDVEPAVCHFGGPTGISATVDVGDLVHHFGQGIAYGETVPGRTGVAAGEAIVSSPQRHLFYSAAIFGDSGSPLIDADGRALGVVASMVVVPFTGMMTATILPLHLDRAAQTTGIEFDLDTAPFHSWPVRR